MRKEGCARGCRKTGAREHGTPMLQNLFSNVVATVMDSITAPVTDDVFLLERCLGRVVSRNSAFNFDELFHEIEVDFSLERERGER